MDLIIICGPPASGKMTVGQALQKLTGINRYLFRVPYHQKKKMNKKEQSKDNQSNAILHALLIGIMIGVVIWSVAKNNVGLFTLVPLFFLYKLLNNSKNDEGKK